MRDQRGFLHHGSTKREERDMTMRMRRIRRLASSRSW
jgi:hypothetical protein